MRWSFNFGTIFGIKFRIHVTFFLLLFFIFISGLSQKGVEAASISVLVICSIFICVLIHELSHSLIAIRFGQVAQSITLLPIGGVATIEEMPEKPSQEIVMSLIGPFINLAIAGILYLFVGGWSGIDVPDLYPSSSRDFLAGLIGVNIIIAVFNLIPAFPMDGGRALRGVLALKMDYIQATSLAVSIGQGLSLFFVFYGIFFNWWLTLIGIFIFIGAGSEKQHVILNSLLRGVRVQDAMITDYHSLNPDMVLSQVLEKAYQGYQDDFPVVEDRGIQGILTRNTILSSIHEKGIDITVKEIMDRNFVSLNPLTMLDDAYRIFRATNKTIAAVIENGTLKGIITLDSISRFFMIQASLKRTH